MPKHLEAKGNACARGFQWQDAYRAAGLVLRDRLLESLNDTNAYYRQEDVKRWRQRSIFKGFKGFS